MTTDSALSADERREILKETVANWIAQGWRLEVLGLCPCAYTREPDDKKAPHPVRRG